jgi:hypothetical protein
MILTVPPQRRHADIDVAPRREDYQGFSLRGEDRGRRSLLRVWDDAQTNTVFLPERSGWRLFAAAA